MPIHESALTPPGKKNITLQEAAEHYGVSVKTIRRYIAEGRLRAYKLGSRTIRVSLDDVEALARPIPAAQPIISSNG
jgi:excisionase family DNA binding protein